MWVTYVSIVSVFSSKLKDLHARNKCSLLLPILEYCCLNKFCNPCQSTLIASNEWYHNLAYPNSVNQNLWTLTPSIKWCTFIQLLEWTRCTSASSSGFPEKSGLKWDQFKCTIYCPSCWVVGVCVKGARLSCWCYCCWACCPVCAGARRG